MKILQDSQKNKYIDQELHDYICKIWVTFDGNIIDGSSLLFAKNTTVHRLIGDYNSEKDIRRVIKPEKATHVVMKQFELSSYPQYYDEITNSITNDDTKEVVYGIYNNSAEEISVIELIYGFIVNKQEVVYINQDILNNSLNNGSIIDINNYNIYTELINSESSDNHKMAVNMILNSDLKSNYEWILYFYHKQQRKLYDYDKSNIFYNYLKSIHPIYNVNDCFEKTDTCLSIIKDADVKNCMVQMIRAKFQKEINNYLVQTIGTSKFKLSDFKLDLK